MAPSTIGSRSTIRLFTLPQSNAPDAWNSERLEYAFSVGGAPGNEEVPLTAAQYAEGHLDWHSVDYDPEINLGAAADKASTPLVRAVIPAPVSFRGAPCAALLGNGGSGDRLWPAACGPGDIPQLMLSEFASGFGNEWYVIPLDLDVGTLTKTRSLVITDSFGVQTLISPVNDPSKPADGLVDVRAERNCSARTRLHLVPLKSAVPRPEPAEDHRQPSAGGSLVHAR